MGKFSESKKVVRNYLEELENVDVNTILTVIEKYTDEKSFSWKGYWPYREEIDAKTCVEKFWKPFLTAFKHLQRREDLFFAGENIVEGGYKGGQWVLSMGHFMGLFDQPWLGMRPTGKIMNIRYNEFNLVENGKITKTALFIDLLGVMLQAGCYPLPPSTGHYFVYPGPRLHNGLQYDDAPENEREKTIKTLDKMIADLRELNDSGSMGCSPDVLRRTWSEKMIWWGTGGIGASYTIDRYQRQHQLPFRNNLIDKKCLGGEVYFAEGNFAALFGWDLTHN